MTTSGDTRRRPAGARLCALAVAAALLLGATAAIAAAPATAATSAPAAAQATAATSPPSAAPASPTAPAGAAKASPADALSDADKACMDCHADEDTMKFPNGDTRSLAIDAAAFARSVHLTIGCADCHERATSKDHPGNAPKVQSAREYELAQVEVCRTCHEKTVKAHEKSLHAARLRAGDANAPTCAGCHPPHQVSRASSSDGPDKACLTCHKDTEAKHGEWLPNAARHLDSVACSACHAPDALRQVDLRFYVGGVPLVDGTIVEFEKRARAADKNRDGLDAAEFRALLSELGRGGGELTVHGHMELRNPTQAHELTAKPTALKACIDCHHEEASPFAKVTVSVLDGDGGVVRYDAHRDVLRSAMTGDALRAFYAVGGTRVKILDVLLALGLVAGISVPVIHYAIRRATRAKK